MQAARVVLSAVAKAFRAAGKSGKDIDQIMRNELDDAASSYGLTTIQRDLLWRELGLFRYSSEQAGDSGEPKRGDGIAPKAEDAPPAQEVAVPNALNCSERRAAVDAYINEVLRETRRRITRTEIWKQAGDKTRTEFERWESCRYEKQGKKANRAAHERFMRILTEKPHLK
jgi:hypothetical protein